MHYYKYLANEKQLIFDHISKEYGSPKRIFYLSQEQTQVPIEFDLLLIEKNDAKILMTFGLGSFISHNHEDKSKERSEIFIELPIDWDFSNPNNKWPISFLVNIARHAYHHHHTLRWTQIFINQESFDNSDKIAGFLDLPWYTDDSLEVEVNGNFYLSFYQVVVITQKELEYQRENGIKALISLFDDGKSRIVNLKRGSLI